MSAVQRHVEAPRIVELRHEADVGSRRRIAEQERASVRSGHRFERGQTFRDPVRIPAVDLRLIVAELGLDVFQHAQIVERMDVAGDGHGHRDDVCAVGRGGGDQRMVGVADVEIVDNRQALGQPVPVDLEHRHQSLRVELAIRA